MTASSQEPFLHSSTSDEAIASSEFDRGFDRDLESPLYFLHIPKTAGTTLYVNMDDRFEVEDICPVRFISELIQLPREAFQTYRFFRGHLGYSLQHFVDRPLRYVTVLRDPIERCISHYEDVRRVPNNFLHHRVNDNQMTFADFARDEVANVTLNNLQARNLAFDWKADRMHGNIPLIKRGIAGTPLGIPDDELLDISMERLRACAVVGVVERFEEATALLSYRFGWYPIRPPRRLNQSAKRMRRDDLDEETISLLEGLNRVDLALYAEATRLFEAQFGAMVADLEQRGLGHPSPNSSPEKSLDLTSALIRHYGDRHSQQATFSSTLNFSVRRPVAGANWYSREGLEPNCTPFRWTGPGTTSTLYLPLKAESDLRLHLRIVRAIAPEVLDSLSLQVNGKA
ncbi:MAG: sulfotransferase family 2 domain-containing protein, partial [Jannaschia sp.]